jgi:hypothetical protein
VRKEGKGGVHTSERETPFLCLLDRVTPLHYIGGNRIDSYSNSR